MLKRTVNPGNEREGFNFMGNKGDKAIPISAAHINATIREKAAGRLHLLFTETAFGVSQLRFTIEVTLFLFFC